jgi:hypothetical protein
MRDRRHEDSEVERMPEDDVTQELIALENRFWTALLESDGNAAAALIDEPCLVVGAQGTGEFDKQTLAGMIANAPYQMLDYQLGDIAVRLVGDGVAILCYRVTEELVVDGQPVALEAFDSSVWVRNGDTWLSVMHTETPARDRAGPRTSQSHPWNPRIGE